MGCGENTKHHQDGDNCVSKILREIVAAQNDVVNHCCDTSCEQSISDLLGETEPGNDLDTVPVILYCKGTCKPFKGFGVGLRNDGRNLRPAVGSFFFRVKKVTRDNCAVLELLLSERDRHHHHHENHHESVEGESSDHRHKKHCNDPESPSCQSTRDLEATGLCLTVDLDCFCHVTCLPAIEALS